MNPADNSDSEFSSVTEWVQLVKEEDSEAARKLWERYWCQLVAVARRQIGKRGRPTAGAEDVAQDAFEGFFRAAAAGRFPKLTDRHDLWQLLLRFTDNRLLDRWKHDQRQKRGGGQVRFESNGSQISSRAGINGVAALEPSPDYAIEMREQLELKLKQLGDDKLRRIAIWKLEGYNNAEIAERLGVVPDTVGRKLNRIRELWATDER